MQKKSFKLQLRNFSGQLAQVDFGSLLLTMAPYLYLVLFAVVTRLIPHPWNATAVASVALFSGRQFKSSLMAFGLPLAIMLISDMILGFHSTMPFVYGATVVTIAIGRMAARGSANDSTMSLGLGTLVSSCSFFVITNFGVWFEGLLYPRTFHGLTECYLMAIPFFRSQLIGDIAYSVLVFGVWAVLKKVSVQVKASF